MRIATPALFATLLSLTAVPAFAAEKSPAKSEAPAKAAMIPTIEGDWWQIAGQAAVGKYNSDKQEPVDFCVWQAADGTWQLWSCIRRTTCPGKTRLLYGWEGKTIDSPNWKQTGIKMEADTSLGETEGGLQAPHVVKHDGVYHMLYGDWEHICLATSKDGKKFERQILPNGKTGIFTEGIGANTRDACALNVNGLWHVYYAAFPNKQCAVYCRTSPDLRNYSESTAVSFGGRSGIGGGSAECPQVVKHGDLYYMFRTQNYRETDGGPRTCVYASRDPMMFGINQDRLYYVTELPVAAPEIVTDNGQDYIVALLPSLKGFRVAKLGWKKQESNL